MKATKSNYRKLGISLIIMLMIMTIAFVIVLINPPTQIRNNYQGNLVGLWNYKTGFYCIKISNRTREEIYNQFDEIIYLLENYSTQIKQLEV